MGVTINAGLPHLLFLKQKYPDFCAGSLLTLGRQDVYFTFEQLSATARAYNIDLESIEPKLITNIWTGKQAIDDASLFEALGFSSIDVLDFVDNERADYVHDLNMPIPTNLTEKWDVIYDAGTLEHVFDIRRAFENIHNMLKVDGIAIHELPTNGFVDHGFWQLSPTALLDCYHNNEYDILESWVWVIDEPGNIHVDTPKRYIYEPHKFAQLSIGKFPKGISGVTFAARKTKSAGFKTPIQGFYMSHWGLNNSKPPVSPISLPGGMLNLEYIDPNPRPRLWLKPIAELFLTVGRALRWNALSALGERLWKS